jgi:outer membrane receptor protein involved in Fe transport
MRPAWILALLLGLTAVPLFAQTTGTIEGTVTDEHGAALPGVTVEAISPNLQGSKLTVSDASGKFHLVFVPPGLYTVKFTLQSFAALERTDIHVELGRVVTLQVQMRSAFKEQVVVSGAAPTIDLKSTESGVNISENQFRLLPSQRNYASYAAVAAGVTLDNGACAASGIGSANSDNVCMNIYGSTGAENAYYIDGVNTTGIRYGVQGKNLNFEFVQELQVKTGGYEAEFGRATGGTINVITKSGGNEYHGSAFGYDDRNSRQSNLSKDVVAISSTLGSSWVQSGYTRNDYGADLGGYVVKDTLWFFGAYDYVKNDSDHQVASDFTRFGGPNYGFPTVGSVLVDEVTRNLWSGKLTYRATDSSSFIVSAFGDPTTETGPIGNVLLLGNNLAGNTNSFMGSNTSGGTDATAKYEGVLGTSWVLDVQAAQHREEAIPGGAGTNTVALTDYTHPLYLQSAVPVQWDGWGAWIPQSRFTRDDYHADLSYFLNNFGGDHELKFGVEQEHIGINNVTAISGGQWISEFSTVINGQPVTYYRHFFYLNRLPPIDPATGKPDPFQIDSSYITPLAVNAKDNNYAAYLQDTYKIGTNLTLDLGVRWERQQLYHKDGTVAADLKKNWAPRLGFVWDPKANGSSKVYGSWGYFYETIPSDIIIRSFGYEIDGNTYNLDGAENDPNRLNVNCDPHVNANIQPCSIYGNGAEPVDPNLKGEYVQEVILGGEQEVAKDLVIGVKGIYRNLERVIEDALTASGGYVIGDPGEGIQKVDFDINGGGPYTTPKATRTFKGIEIDVRKRFTNNWQLFGSYLYSKLYGNYDGTYEESYGQLDPNISAAYDFAEFQIHNGYNGETGPLANDRRHQFKVNASYAFPFGLNAGISAYWRSGVPITAYGYCTAYLWWNYTLSDRGAFGTTPTEYEADLHVDYPFKFKGAQVTLLMDVFDLLNRQGVTGVDMHYDLAETYEVINYSGTSAPGTIVPAIKPGDKLHPPTNPAFGQPNRWQAPRSIRLGVRLSF